MILGVALVLLMFPLLVCWFANRNNEKGLDIGELK